MKQPPGSIARMGKTASVLLKPFIIGKERCHTTNAHKRMSGTLFSNVNNIKSMIPEGQKKHYKVMKYGETFCSRHTGT